ncbi:Uncharacterized protein, contains ferredoxin domain [Geosporobacter subterraneus DSM 17957]|uniref:Uncharacterized protein, contains ferredoxin domain n=1 Tax=Geosporobacter subterraneus DSM 17957 TaxID=1121919 RepID=A0A1M6P470_9FIRM|nr:DUF2148 domain-containing protein [Geosporobacter subterraneus]SHK02686.1 Uncharacterized protein, contains ferredoxin domain [Geosporobacter subterraneus DSM 17957]
MLYNSHEVERDALMQTAGKMCIAARTAPKGKGVDQIVTAIVTGEEKDAIADEMEKIGEREKLDFFIRDAGNIRRAPVVVLIGTTVGQRGLSYCGFCGFENCGDQAKKGGRCSFDVVDLGIAVGAAVSVASDDRVDNRVMFSIGKAAIDLKVLDEAVKVLYGIPLAAYGKNIFFDRVKV